MNNFYKVRVLTEELIISKADVDFDTDPDKREHVEKLEKDIVELLK